MRSSITVDRRALLSAGGFLTIATILQPARLLAQGNSSSRIGIIGSGNIGGTIGGLWVKKGHSVFFSSRHPDELKDMVVKLGNLAQNLGNITGPASLGFNMSLSKKVVVRESMNFTVRADAVNFLNTPVWANPNTNINSNDFGRITSASGNRTITLSARFDF